MLKYALVENVLSTNPQNYVAVVSSPESKDLNDVVNFMIAEGTGLTRPQALAYFEKLTQTIEYFVGQGHRVITPLLRVRPTITGVFSSLEDNFDSSKHQVNFRAMAGARLQELATKIKLEKVVITQQVPVLKSFTDGISGDVNLSATAGGIGSIKGKMLKFDASDNRQGVFFVAENDPSDETRVDIYTEIKPSVIHFQMPYFNSGTYIIVVKTLSRNGSSVVKGEMNRAISVA